TGGEERSVSLALVLSQHLLHQKGAWRVHGGGFAGTIQAFVPSHMVEEYCTEMEKIFGADSCYRLAVRPVGGYVLK
ncbi:MAG: galactokinase, partial [Angelakisella sp.]